MLAAAAAQGWEALKAAHEADLAALLGRAAVDLGADPADALLTTDALLTGCRNGRRSRYLEETYWQYGRYLLVSSSRPGSLPANLQGVWTAHRKSPWGSGYWHNINVQMNYWPAFSANLAECFRPYAEFNAAFRPGTRAFAVEYLRRHGLPDLPKDDEAQDMWCVGTAVWPYVVDGGPGGHSGPGTGGLTTKLFVDWYDFTLDREALERYVWPVVHGMADFLSRCVVETNGLFLSKFSASPEQMVGHLEDHFRWGVDKAQYYTTVGCAFDQQMIAENNADCLRLAKELGVEDGVTAKIRSQIAKYDPVQVGADGQIKEFREETHYSDIGQRHHRHISQLRPRPRRPGRPRAPAPRQSPLAAHLRQPLGRAPAVPDRRQLRRHGRRHRDAPPVARWFCRPAAGPACGVGGARRVPRALRARRVRGGLRVALRRADKGDGAKLRGPQARRALPRQTGRIRIQADFQEPEERRTQMTIGFIGAGKMAEGILSAIEERKGVVMAEKVAERAAEMSRKYGVATTGDAKVVAKKAKFFFLAVRPQDVDAVAAEVKPLLTEKHTLVSIVAGKTLAKLRKAFGAKANLVRVMPNLALRANAGMCAICPAAKTPAKDVKLVEKILGGAGATVVLKEKDFDAVTALSGSGPAYFAYMEEAMVEGGVKLGLKPKVARLLAEQTMYGTAKFLRESGMDLRPFIEGVCTKGGTTAAGMEKLDVPKFKQIVAATLAAAAKRSRELA